MEKRGFDLDDGSSPADAKQTNLQEARKLSIQRSIKVLVHVRQCRDANCRFPNCCKMKRVLMHTKNCKRKQTNAGCPIFKQLIALCYYHAKQCQETNCLVPFSSHIKHEIKYRQQQQRLLQAQLSRQMAMMTITRPSVPAGMPAGQPSNVAMATGVATKPGVSTSNLPSSHPRC